MPLVLSGSTGITSDNIASLATSKLTGQVADGNAPSGSVIQVVQAVVTAPITFNNTLADAISVSITPSSTNSKVLIEWDTVWGRGVDDYGAFYLYKNGSKMYGAVGDASYQDYQRATGAIMNRGSGQDNYVTHANSGKYLDSPSTTSAITYTIKAQCHYGSNIYLNRAEFVGDTGYQIRSISTLTVMEIAG
jgi:hypothetical protein